MDKVVHYLGMIFLLSVVSSCIRESSSECVSQYTIRVFVKDKNYSNVDAISPQDKVDESISFRKFVGTVYYTLSQLSTGALVQESSVTSVTGDGDYLTLTLKDVPYGDYKLTVWGNNTTDAPVGNLHQSNQEQTDIYLGSSDIKVNETYLTSDITLQRTKGLLLVRFTNFPTYIKAIRANVTGVYESINPDFMYSGTTFVRKEAPFQMQSQVLLAPSVGEGVSKLQLKLYTATPTGETELAVTLPETPITVHRNEMSLVAVDYNVPTGKWEIWIYINGEWTKIHSLDVEEISI